MKRWIIHTLLLLLTVSVLAMAKENASAPRSQAGELVIVKKVVVNAPITEVWKAWTTNEGAQTFFAPKTNIQAEIAGPYEIFFSPDAAPGQRGAEDLLVHDLEPGKSITFQWSAPPQFPAQRKLRTFVTVTVTELAPNQTQVELRHYGFGHGTEWAQVHGYFVKAWDYVLANLSKRFTSGPIEWSKR